MGEGRFPSKGFVLVPPVKMPQGEFEPICNEMNVEKLSERNEWNDSIFTIGEVGDTKPLSFTYPVRPQSWFPSSFCSIFYKYRDLL